MDHVPVVCCLIAKDSRRLEDLSDQLYSTLEEGHYLGRSCPWRPTILKTVFKLLDQQSPRLLLKLARLILAVRHSCSLFVLLLYDLILNFMLDDTVFLQIVWML